MIIVYIILALISIIIIVTSVSIIKSTNKIYTPIQHLTPDQSRVLSYLYAVYPMGSFNDLNGNDILKLYNSLSWYYLPLTKDIDNKRRGPIKGPYYDTECQWFMADGTDCGNFDTDDNGNPQPGTFTCSVFGGCNNWEFGQGGGRPYQYISMIQPYNRRNGTPNNAYIESVAFVCESLGRMLLTAGDDKPCQFVAPTWQQFLNNDQAGKTTDWNIKESYSNCPNKTKCDGNDPGCKIIPYVGGQASTCCWDYNKNSIDNSVCHWPMTCMAEQHQDDIYSNYCAIPCGYVGCDPTDGCTWNVDGDDWVTWLQKQHQPKSYYSAKKIIQGLEKTRPTVNKSLPSPRHDVDIDKTMFFWCKGYGKFLNMGKTGIYFNYVHFLLTCPKYSQDGTPIRWSFPQILQTANRAFTEQLISLMSGKYHDNRKYLEGFVTTLRGKEYEGYGKGVYIVPNKIKHKTENVNGLFNPQDDDNLIMVDKVTVTKYYPPENKIANPQYKNRIQFTPLQAVCLFQGMHIYGATTNSTEYPFVSGHQNKPDHYGSGTYPFGVRFIGTSLGHCVYQLTKMCGWDSSQFTQLPTVPGGKKYCNYPEYDYEIVYIQSKDQACNTDFKMLNPVADWDNYIHNGFVQGTDQELNVRPFDSNKMRLTERNVPDDWKGPHPNATMYQQPQNYIYDKTTCPYEDNLYTPYLTFSHA